MDNKPEGLLMRNMKHGLFVKVPRKGNIFGLNILKGKDYVKQYNACRGFHKKLQTHKHI